MLSPVGVPYKPDPSGLPTQPSEEVKEGAQKPREAPPKFFQKIARKVWDKKISPFSIMRKSGNYIGKKMVSKYLQKRMANLP